MAPLFPVQDCRRSVFSCIAFIDHLKNKIKTKKKTTTTTTKTPLILRPTGIYPSETNLGIQLFHPSHHPTPCC